MSIIWTTKKTALDEFNEFVAENNGYTFFQLCNKGYLFYSDPGVGFLKRRGTTEETVYKWDSIEEMMSIHLQELNITVRELFESALYFVLHIYKIKEPLSGKTALDAFNEFMATHTRYEYFELNWQGLLFYSQPYYAFLALRGEDNEVEYAWSSVEEMLPSMLYEIGMTVQELFASAPAEALFIEED